MEEEEWRNEQYPVLGSHLIGLGSRGTSVLSWSLVGCEGQGDLSSILGAPWLGGSWLLCGHSTSVAHSCCLCTLETQWIVSENNLQSQLLVFFPFVQVLFLKTAAGFPLRAGGDWLSK